MKHNKYLHNKIRSRCKLSKQKRMYLYAKTLHAVDNLQLRCIIGLKKYKICNKILSYINNECYKKI